MTKSDARAVKIVELQEELTEAKRIIGEFVCGSDFTPEERQKFMKQAARFAGVTVPVYSEETEEVEAASP
jgi:hypothetical protein